MSSIEEKIMKFERKFLKLNGDLKLQVHSKSRIIEVGNLHKKYISELEKSDSEYIEASRKFFRR